MSNGGRTAWDISWGEEIPPDFREDASQRSVVPSKEIEQDAQELAERLERLMGEFTDVPYTRDEGRYEYFVSRCLSLFEQRYVIEGPTGSQRGTGASTANQGYGQV